MPKVNQYIIFDEIKKKYYDNNMMTDFYSTLNNAWSFDGRNLRYQTQILRRNDEVHEIILKVGRDGTLTKVR